MARPARRTLERGSSEPGLAAGGGGAAPVSMIKTIASDREECHYSPQSPSGAGRRTIWCPPPDGPDVFHLNGDKKHPTS